MKIGLLVLLSVLVAVALVSGSASPRRPAGARGESPAAQRARSTVERASSPGEPGPSAGRLASLHAAAADLARRPSPGSLPQTHVLPSAGTAGFRRLMAGLWAGIVSGRAGPAMVAFFPRGAYVQLKAIESAGADWSERLVHDYALDIGAAHALLGSGAPSARLLSVDVPSSYGHWVPPGVCDNGIGYYEAPNARIVYREHGQTRSFGIASLISWRGVWYVVHLGAILRSSDSGTVDEPAAGRGVSLYSGTC